MRPKLVLGDDLGDDLGMLFLTDMGDPICSRTVTYLVRDYVNAAEIGKRGSCHLSRHSMATLMLENGTDIRHIQLLLGHARLDTTQIYTQVGIRQLKEVHSRLHPAGRSGRTENAGCPQSAPRLDSTL